MRCVCLLLLLSVSLVGCKPTAEPPDAQTEATPAHYAIGPVHRSISTESEAAQLWFDRGLAMAYGFNHEEAVVCFDKVIEADPAHPMGYWGKAYALGPNYNNPEMLDEVILAADAAIDQAMARLDAADDAERALIEALRRRYGRPGDDRASLDQAYAEAMRGVLRQFPEDADIIALTAEALMQLRPWQLWTPQGQPAAETPEIRSVLEAGLARSPKHPALCHLYIHAMEAGPEVEQATAAAEALEGLAPGLGHLVHMSSHIYTWTGRYDDVIRVNQQAVEADRAYVDHAGRNNFFTLYRLHNYHFVAYGGMWDGRKELALQAARELVTEIPDGLMQQMPDFLDVFVGTPFHVMVRFGMWEEILAEPAPQEPLFAARAVHAYARGIALASLDRVDEAVAAQQAFRQASAEVPESRLLFNNPVSEILAVADAVLDGEIEYRKGNHAAAFDRLRQAVALDEQLNYDEPWGWMEPARHPLGALLTEQSRYEEALEVYRANLQRYPDNGWALHGMAESLRGLGRTDEAAEVQARFEAAWSDADVTIPGSCFCKQSAAG